MPCRERFLLLPREPSPRVPMRSKKSFFVLILVLLAPFLPGCGNGISGNGAGIDGGGRVKRLADGLAGTFHAYAEKGVPPGFCRSTGESCRLRHGSAVCDRLDVIVQDESRISLCRDHLRRHGAELASILAAAKIEVGGSALSVGGRSVEARIERRGTDQVIVFDPAFLS